MGHEEETCEHLLFCRIVKEQSGYTGITQEETGLSFGALGGSYFLRVQEKRI
jgi:hypothetical protein